MSSPKTVVIGLDGAHFELLQPWLDDGKLPNIKQAIDTGISTDLESVLPPVTSPNWKAYATGRNPAKLGIFWWENVDIEGQRVYYPSERKNIHTEFWELLGEQERVGVLGVPTTYPPKNINGFFVSGAPDAENTGYTYPSYLEEELESKYDYKVTKRNRLSVNRDEAVEEILGIIDSRFSVAKDLADEYDVSFLQITTFYLNSLHHYLWDDEATLRGWQIIDDHISEYLNGNTNLVLMSDHGSTKIETVFHVNSWLEQEGYLTLNTGFSDYLHKMGITKERMINLAYLFHVPRLAERLAPDILLNRLPDDEGELNRESKTDAVDWDNSIALASGQGPVYLLKGRNSDRYEKIRSEIIRKLEGLEGPRGTLIADEVHRGEDIYSGEYLNESPDIVIEQRNGVHIAGGVGRNEVFSAPKIDDWIAENKREGMFVASGPDCDVNKFRKLSILDLAPLFLHLHECEIPQDMDGNVPKWVFNQSSLHRHRDVRRTHHSELQAEIKNIKRIARIENL